MRKSILAPLLAVAVAACSGNPQKTFHPGKSGDGSPTEFVQPDVSKKNKEEGIDTRMAQEIVALQAKFKELKQVIDSGDPKEDIRESCLNETAREAIASADEVTSENEAYKK